MTREEIMKLEGYELDIAVAEKVMGIIFPTVEEMKKIAEDQWKVQPSCRDFFMGFYAWEEEDGEFNWRYKTKSYSTDITSAWEVLEKYPLSMIERVEIFEGHTTVNVTIFPDPDKGWSVFASAITLPEAATKAALLAVMELII